MRQAEALWMDETHYPREGISNWVWAAVQPLLAVFAIYCWRWCKPRNRSWTRPSRER